MVERVKVPESSRQVFDIKIGAAVWVEGLLVRSVNQPPRHHFHKRFLCFESAGLLWQLVVHPCQNIEHISNTINPHERVPLLSPLLLPFDHFAFPRDLHNRPNELIIFVNL